MKSIIICFIIWKLTFYLGYRVSGWLHSDNTKCKLKWKDIKASYALNEFRWEFSRTKSDDYIAEYSVYRHLIYSEPNAYTPIIVILNPIQYEKIKFYAWLKNRQHNQQMKRDNAERILKYIRK